MGGTAASAVRGAQLRRFNLWSAVFSGELVFLTPDAYFLNRFSNAARASFGFNAAGVEVSFSRVTRIS